MKIEVKITPKPLSRPRINTTNKGRYLPSRCQKYLEELRLMVSSVYKGKVKEKPLVVTLHFYKKIKPTAKKYGDIDNLAKAVLDACNGVLWIDDSQITELHAYKHYGTGKIEMEVLERYV